MGDGQCEVPGCNRPATYGFNPATCRGHARFPIATLQEMCSPEPRRPGAVPRCEVPPPGWRCTRGAGHDGPCAAVLDAGRRCTWDHAAWCSTYRCDCATWSRREKGGCQCEECRRWRAEQHLSGDEAALRGEVVTWACETFRRDPEDVRPVLLHLRREVRELLDSGGRDVEEFADALMVLWHAAHVGGWSWQNVLDAARSKLAKNRERTWGPPDAEGVVEHVRPVAGPPRATRRIDTPDARLEVAYGVDEIVLYSPRGKALLHVEMLDRGHYWVGIYSESDPQHRIVAEVTTGEKTGRAVLMEGP